MMRQLIFGVTGPYCQSVSPQSDEPTGNKRFVPATLFPYGGFGDVDVDAPYTRVPKGTDADSALQAAAQDRLARSVRRVLRERSMTEAELEERLGYRRYGLVRKLNGNEQLTMRDVARLGTAFDAGVLGVLSAEASTAQKGRLMAEPLPRYESDDEDGETSVTDLMADAALKLRRAAERLRDEKGDEGFSDAITHLSKAILALGSQRNEILPPRKARK